MSTELLPWALLLLLFLTFSCRRCHAFATFGFDFHHRLSDPVKGVLDVGDFRLPLKGSLPYYAAMAHRDRAVHGRRLAADATASVTFAPGNETYRLSSLGFLHYANVTIGTPKMWFLVALDTGSDLFWLPCDCSRCVSALRTSAGQTLDFNIYSPNTSSTSAAVPCSSSTCTTQSHCDSALSSCPYQVLYLSNGTSSTGYLVEDVLHLVTDNDMTKAVEAQITLGCGQIETGSFLNGAAPNGLFGLGMKNVSVPSRLAKEGVTANSFSMCFSPDGNGRISFGDKGSTGQRETPFNMEQSHPTYNVTVTQLSIGGNTQDVEFPAIFDSGTSFTYLSDPAYSLISQRFDSIVQDQRLSTDSELPFQYCYGLSSNQTSYAYPTVNLTMKGGHQFSVNDPTEVVKVQDNSYIYCLALVKSGDVNIIGQNFMTGYRIIFNREKNVLGWKESDCYSANNASSIDVPRSNTKAIPPAVAVNPEATSGGGDSSRALSNSLIHPWLLSCYISITVILLSFFCTA